MKPPCGHDEAKCVIGNYWACEICDKEEEVSDSVTFSEPAATNAVRNHTLRFGYADEDTDAWDDLEDWYDEWDSVTADFSDRPVWTKLQGYLADPELIAGMHMAFSMFSYSAPIDFFEKANKWSVGREEYTAAFTIRSTDGNVYLFSTSSKAMEIHAKHCTECQKEIAKSFATPTAYVTYDYQEPVSATWKFGEQE